MNVLGTKAEYSLLVRSFYLSVSSKTDYPPRTPRKLSHVWAPCLPLCMRNTGTGMIICSLDFHRGSGSPASCAEEVWNSPGQLLQSQQQSLKIERGPQTVGQKPKCFSHQLNWPNIYQLRTDLNLTLNLYGSAAKRLSSSSLTWTKHCYFSTLQMSGDKDVHWGHCLQLVHVKGICPVQVWPDSLQVRISCSSPHWDFGDFFLLGVGVVFFIYVPY